MSESKDTANTPATESNIETGVVNDKEGEVQAPKRKFIESLAAALSFALIGFSLATMILVQSSTILVAGILSVLLGPYVVYQVRQLAVIEGLIKINEDITAEIDRLTKENIHLEGVVKNLTGTVSHLEDIESALSMITEAQSENVEELRENVETNEKILERMQANLKGAILQNMLSVVIGSDLDKDLHIDATEIDDLIDRLGRITGVTIYADRLKKAILDDGGEHPVRSMFKDGDQGPEPIFTISLD